MLARSSRDALMESGLTQRVSRVKMIFQRLWDIQSPCTLALRLADMLPAQSTILVPFTVPIRLLGKGR